LQGATQAFAALRAALPPGWCQEEVSSRVEAVSSRVEEVSSRVEAVREEVSSRVEAVSRRVEEVSCMVHEVRQLSKTLVLRVSDLVEVDCRHQTTKCASKHSGAAVPQIILTLLFYAHRHTIRATYGRGFAERRTFMTLEDLASHVLAGEPGTAHNVQTAASDLAVWLLTGKLPENFVR
jgi:hypothetical protein